MVSGKSFVRPLVMEVPIDEPIRINLVSNDVMHEFFVPTFFFMRNAMPGHPNSFTWTPNKLGTFQGQCAEFCALAHYQMRFEVKIVRTPDFLTWVEAGEAVHPELIAPRRPIKNSRLTAHNMAWNTNSGHHQVGRTWITIQNQDSVSITTSPSSDGPELPEQLFIRPQFAGVATKSFDIATSLAQEVLLPVQCAQSGDIQADRRRQILEREAVEIAVVERGRRASAVRRTTPRWVTTTDQQRIGILYFIDSLAFFAVADLTLLECERLRTPAHG